MSHIILDIIGDLLSKCRYHKLWNLEATNPMLSSLYPRPTYLADSSEVDREGCIVIVALPNNRDNRCHHNSSRRTASTRTTRHGMGDLLANHVSRSGPHHDFTHRLPHLVRRSL